MNVLLVAMLNGVLLGIPLAAAVWALLRLAHRVLNAATRYVIWWATLLMAALLPLCCVPAGNAANRQPARETPVLAEIAVRTPDSVMPAAVPAWRLVQSPARGTSARPPIFPVAIRESWWVARLAIFWAASTLLMLVRLAISALALSRQRKRASDAPLHLNALVVQCLQRLGVRRHVRVVITDNGASPMLAGPFRPCILIPSRLLAALDPAELEQVYLHEAAHLARFDDYALLLQRFIEALLVLHPAIGWIGRQIDLEREVACDDRVIAATGEPRFYASCLTHVAELICGYPTSPVAAAAADESSHLARRIGMLLDRTRRTGTGVLKTRLTAGFAALALLTWCAARSPSLLAIAAEQPAPKPVTHSVPIASRPVALAPPVAMAQTPAARPAASPARRVTVQVTVTDPSSRFVTGLDKSAFHVYEDGVEQEVISVGNGDANFLLSIVSNGSGNLRVIEGQIVEVERKLAELRRVYRESYPDAVLLRRDLEQLDTKRDRLASLMSLAGIQPPPPGGNEFDSGLLNSLRASIAAAKAHANERRAIVIVFDPRDNSILWPESELHALIRDARLPIYTIAVANIIGNSGVEPGTFLNLLTEATGGRHFVVTEWTDIPEIERKIGIELQNQYTLTYGSKTLVPDGNYRKIEIRMEPERGIPPLQAHTMPGYYAEIR